MYHATLTMVELKFLISKSPNKKILDAPNPWDPNLLPSSQILLKEMGLWLFNLGTNLWSLLFGYLKTIHDVDELLKILTSIHGIMGPWGWVFVGRFLFDRLQPLPIRWVGDPIGISTDLGKLLRRYESDQVGE